jgi:hypothetical protein
MDWALRPLRSPLLRDCDEASSVALAHVRPRGREVGVESICARSGCKRVPKRTHVCNSDESQLAM